MIFFLYDRLKRLAPLGNGYLHAIALFFLDTPTTMAADDPDGFNYEKYLHCIRQIVDVSNQIQDGWQMQTKEVIFFLHVF